MAKDIWENIHKQYATTDWIDKPSVFAEQAVEYFPKQGKILDLGAGQGQDSRFFAEKGYEVVSTDREEKALEASQAKLGPEHAGKVTVEKADLNQPLAYEDESFDVVYAHLSLHYFDIATTNQIFDEIYRILKPGGTVAFFTNSTDDPEYDTGERIEPDYFMIEDTAKRYLTVETARSFAAKFTELLADNQGETYKDSAKGIHNLIRYIGKKSI